jgi:hypothetical protein
MKASPRQEGQVEPAGMSCYLDFHCVRMCVRAGNKDIQPTFRGRNEMSIPYNDMLVAFGESSC